MLFSIQIIKQFTWSRRRGMMDLYKAFMRRDCHLPLGHRPQSTQHTESTAVILQRVSAMWLLWIFFHRYPFLKNTNMLFRRRISRLILYHSILSYLRSSVYDDAAYSHHDSGCIETIICVLIGNRISPSSFPCRRKQTIIAGMNSGLQSGRTRQMVSRSKTYAVYRATQDRPVFQHHHVCREIKSIYGAYGYNDRANAAWRYPLGSGCACQRSSRRKYLAAVV